MAAGRQPEWPPYGRKNRVMTGENLLQQFFAEVRPWLMDGEVHYRVCPHQGQPHYRSDEPCVWMSPQASHAFLAWTVQRGFVTPARSQVCLRHGRLQEASALADAAASAGVVQPGQLRGLVALIRRSPLPALLVGLGVGVLLGRRLSQRP